MLSGLGECAPDSLEVLVKLQLCGHAVHDLVHSTLLTIEDRTACIDAFMVFANALRARQTEVALHFSLVTVGTARRTPAAPEWTAFRGVHG